MERILYWLSYSHSYTENERRYKRDIHTDKESIIFDVKSFAEYAHIDTNIIETEDTLYFRFYFPKNFSLKDLGLPSFEHILSCCDGLRLRKSKEELVN